jgi:hypothetical protein
MKHPAKNLGKYLHKAKPASKTMPARVKKVSNAIKRGKSK